MVPYLDESVNIQTPARLRSALQIRRFTYKLLERCRKGKMRPQFTFNRSKDLKFELLLAKKNGILGVCQKRCHPGPVPPAVRIRVLPLCGFNSLSPEKNAVVFVQSFLFDFKVSRAFLLSSLPLTSTNIPLP